MAKTVQGIKSHNEIQARFDENCNIIWWKKGVIIAESQADELTQTEDVRCINQGRIKIKWRPRWRESPQLSSAKNQLNFL